MNELWQCRICSSLVARDQIGGRCRICGDNTCGNCKRICDRCQKICCMLHMEAKIVMRQQQPHLHKLCLICLDIW